ncbi:cupin domain-containing protein [Chitinimonas sp. BJB300]|uniref:cupin domain-containing protein n=1 Tax=Chitinimonas sp. BJB300 TaxID=1559339 RepID=UPI000C11AF99|nr:cupin domain-containing protein [Chitinimonas sp. BJB300]PHV11739.1 cupin [Chitinimonas sp. BJB300]TSJ90016.1 cupin domain-containing protein [Chitinimonas sp. BJB300]
MQKPDCIKHYTDIQEADNKHYPGSAELHCITARFGKTFGFERLAIHHQILQPGRRTSWPHAEKIEEEFVYIIEGTPEVWLDGVLYKLQPGDGVGFKPGDGLAHTFINNTNTDVHLLVVGEVDQDYNQVHYPMHPARNTEIGAAHWKTIPQRAIGPHDGLPDALRAQFNKD